MKQINTYQLEVNPTGMYPGAADADYGQVRGVFKLNREEEG